MSDADANREPIRTGFRQPRIWAGVCVLAAVVVEAGFHHSAWPLWAVAVCFAVEHGKQGVRAEGSTMTKTNNAHRARSWTFNLYEPGHFDAGDLVLTPAVGYGWYRLGHWVEWSPWFWIGLSIFIWLVASVYVEKRKQGLLRMPWELRSGTAQQVVQTWSRTTPTVAVVQERQRAEGQPVRFWLRHTKPDGHGNERYVVEMRVMDGKLLWLIPDEDHFERWTEAVLDAKYDDAEWAWCVPPDVV